MKNESKAIVKNHIGITALGVALQAAGAVCLISAAVGMVKDTTALLKQKLLEELTK